MERTPPGPDDAGAGVRRRRARLIIFAIVAMTALPLLYATCVWVVGSQMD
jgi:hypothetical protein